jgi:hypothetical protein
MTSPDIPTNLLVARNDVTSLSNRMQRYLWTLSSTKDSGEIR